MGTDTKCQRQLHTLFLMVPSESLPYFPLTSLAPLLYPSPLPSRHQSPQDLDFGFLPFYSPDDYNHSSHGLNTTITLRDDTQMYTFSSDVHLSSLSNSPNNISYEMHQRNIKIDTDHFQNGPLKFSPLYSHGSNQECKNHSRY